MITHLVRIGDFYRKGLLLQEAMIILIIASISLVLKRNSIAVHLKIMYCDRTHRSTQASIVGKSDLRD